MNREYQAIALRELQRSAAPSNAAGLIMRPSSGWIRAVRQALGLSLRSVGQRLKITGQAIHGLERSEATGTISIADLQRVADAMDCRLVYTFLPKSDRWPEVDGSHVAAVSHSMALEGQPIRQAGSHG